MKRIVFVVPILAPYAIERFSEMSRNMQIELHIIVEKSNDAERVGNEWEFQRIPGCHVHLLDSKDRDFHVKNTKSGYTQRNSRIFSVGLKKIIRNIQPDIVIVCNSTQLLFLQGRRKYKLGIVVEDTLRAEESRKPINRWVKRTLMKTVDFYLPFNDEAIKFLYANGLKGASYKSTWSINPQLFSTLKSKNQIEQKKEEFGLQNTCNYTIIASLIERKGIIPFLNGWSCMPEAFHKKNTLNIIGVGPLQADIEQFIREKKLQNVHLIGSLSYVKVGEFMQCSDVFVLPTLEDVWGMVTMEAMASGLPVMITPYAGSKELVEDGVTGYLFDSMCNDSIVEALEKMDSSDLAAMKKNAKVKIANYSNEIVIKELTDILLGLS